MNGFVDYLNGLHSYNAKNRNAYVEQSRNSPYYRKTLVSIPLCKFIVSKVLNEEPQVIILTGHAGDGKTSIMFQVLESFNIDPFNEPRREVITPKGRTILCIKDFSELADDRKLVELKTVLESPSKGKFAFVVANTGPLINTYGNIYESQGRKEDAKMQIIDAMDSNDGTLKDVMDDRLVVINIAALDNMHFVADYLKRITDISLWETCDNCPKKGFCHILNNIHIITDNIERTSEFITLFYFRQNEYGTRLTIRSMVEHLAFMITGGLGCADVRNRNPLKLLYPDLFFGFRGVSEDLDAENIIAVKAAKATSIYTRRIRSDEDLLIRRDYNKLFGRSVQMLIDRMDGRNHIRSIFEDQIKRIYLFTNIVAEDQHRKDIEDFFSKQFEPYLDIVTGKTSIPSKTMKNMVIDALRMLYMGTVLTENKSQIPITMGAKNSITQSVQMVVGQLYVSGIELKTEAQSKLSKERKNLVLKTNGRTVGVLPLPVIDYFEELKNGIIPTNLDPQLSHGIENLKTKLMELTQGNEDEDDFNFLVLKNVGYRDKPFFFDGDSINLS